MDVGELISEIESATERGTVGNNNVLIDLNVAVEIAKTLETLQTEKEDTYNRLLKLTETMGEFGREAKIMIERDKRLKAIVEQYENTVVPKYEALFERLTAENITLRAERDALLKSFKVKPVGLEERRD